MARERTVPRRFGGGSSIKVVDLDGDGEPEILLDFWTGGAHCCTWTRIYRWTGTTYENVKHVWGDTGYALDQLGPGVANELVTGDDRFAYAFSCFACSSFPLQIWSYRPGRLVDVTRKYPALVARDALQQWSWFQDALSAEGKTDTRGVLAAWVADKCLLGRCASAFAWMRAHPQAYTVRHAVGDFGHGVTAASYRAALRRFLRRTGYLR